MLNENINRHIRFQKRKQRYVFWDKHSEGNLMKVLSPELYIYIIIDFRKERERDQ